MRKIVPACLLALAGAGIASAHHSAAMFDASKTIVIEGVVKQFQWTNPHSWLIVEAKQPDGTTREWSIEMTSPNLLTRAGWRPSTIKPGSQIRVVASPLRDGSPGAQFRCATLPEGRLLTYQSASGSYGTEGAVAKTAEQACGGGAAK